MYHKHTVNIIQDAIDHKLIAGGLLTTTTAFSAWLGDATEKVVVVVDQTRALESNAMSMMMAIFAGFGTGCYMITNIVINSIRIKRQLNHKRRSDDLKTTPD